jgi:hypothetical protein
MLQFVSSHLLQADARDARMDAMSRFSISFTFFSFRPWNGLLSRVGNPGQEK